MAEPTKPAEDDAKKPRAPKAAKEAAPKPEAAEVQGEPAKVEAAVAAPAEPKKKTAPKAKKEEEAAHATAPAENITHSTNSIEQQKIVKAKGSMNINNG